MAIKYAPVPVVAAPFGMALGGGCEVAMHAARVQASAEAYMGLVEVGVGLIPAGGGCKELLLRLQDNLQQTKTVLEPAAISNKSALPRRQQARPRRARWASHYLRGWRFEVSMNPERLIADAKEDADRDLARFTVPNYAPGAPRQDIKVRGEIGQYALS